MTFLAGLFLAAASATACAPITANRPSDGTVPGLFPSDSSRVEALPRKKRVAEAQQVGACVHAHHKQAHREVEVVSCAAGRRNRLGNYPLLESDGNSPGTVPSLAQRSTSVPLEHGKLTWYQGSFDALLAESTKSKKLVFLDFWTSWCGWCKRLDKDTFSDAAVVLEMNDLLCFSVDGESPEGSALVARFGVTNYPALVFLEPDGSQRDRISGYLPPAGFLVEVRRIERGENTLADLRRKTEVDPKSVFARLAYAEKLQRLNLADDAQRELALAQQSVARNEGFDPTSVDARWKLAQALEALGDSDGALAQRKAIEELDPEGTSHVRRRIALFELVGDFNRQYAETQELDTLALETFLAAEKYADLLFTGWDKVQTAQAFLAEEARKREKDDDARVHRAAARRAGREAWKHCPPEMIADWGKFLAYAYYVDADDLSDDEKSFAIEVARKALEAAPASTDHMEMLACTLDAAGKRDEALALLDKALALEPGKKSLAERREEFRR